MQWRGDGLWRNADFLKLWAGESVSLVGAQITILALPLTAVLRLRASPAQVGLLNAVAYLPFLFLTLPAGVWLDRHRRRPVMIAANLGRAALLSLIPVLAVMGRLRMEALYAVALLVGACTVFFHLAYLSFLPTLVGRGGLVEGNAKLGISESAAQVGGPGLAGLMVQIVTAPLALLANVASFLVSAASLALIRLPEPLPAVTQQRRRLGSDVGAGLRFTFSNPYLRAIAAEATTYNVFWQIVETVFVLYAVRALRIGPALLGLILSIGSVGALLGALLTNSAARRYGIGRIILWSSVLSCLAPLLIPLAVTPGPGAVALLMLAFFLCGIGVTACNVHVVSVRQAITPDHLLGRMNASYRLITYGAIPLGAGLAGVLGSGVGLHATLVIAALGLAFAWLWLAFSPVRALRRLPTAPDEHVREIEEELAS